MGNIGEEKREYEFEPIEQPITVPIEQPTEPEKVPA